MSSDRAQAVSSGGGEWRSSMMPIISSMPSANCLLKTLEEPPPHSLLILIGTSPAGSCRRFARGRRSCDFAPLDTDAVVRILVETGAGRRSQASRASGRAERRQRRARHRVGRSRHWRISRTVARRACERRRLIACDWRDRCRHLSMRRARRRRSKRDRLRIVIGFAVEYYRERACAEIAAADGLRWRGRSTGRAAWPRWNTSTATQIWALVIQNWCEELADRVMRPQARRLSARLMLAWHSKARTMVL